MARRRPAMKSDIVHKLRRARSLLQMSLASNDDIREAEKLVGEALSDLEGDP
jgi:hypothetical protein